MNNSSLIISSSNNKRDKNMFTEIQQYIKDKDYPVNNDDSTCLQILADFKESLPDAHEEIQDRLTALITLPDSVLYFSDDGFENYERVKSVIYSVVTDALDGHHETLTNLITYHTNDYIKTINAEIEDIEEEARESANDNQQDIDSDNSERLRSI